MRRLMRLPMIGLITLCTISCATWMPGRSPKSLLHESGLLLLSKEDDVVEVDGKPGRIVRCGIWSTTFFTYDVREGIIVGGAKLVVQNDKLKDIKIEKPLPLLDLSKYKVDTSCQDLLTELTRVQKKQQENKK